MKQGIIKGWNSVYSGEDRQVFDNDFPGMYTLVRYGFDGRPKASIISKEDVASKYKMSLYPQNTTFNAWVFNDENFNTIVATPTGDSDVTVILTTFIDNVPYSDVVTLNSVARKYGENIANLIDENIG